jgi:parallel beta-helix repeat protein
MKNKGVAIAFVFTLLFSVITTLQYINLAVANFDFIAPTVTIVEPENRTYDENVPVYVLASDYISGIEWIGYSLDGSYPFTIIASPEGNQTTYGSTTISGLTVGTHSLTAYAHEDCGGMVGNATVYFTITYSSPTDAGTIYIRADGSVEGTDKIQRDGDVYTFTGNISGWIQVQRSNIVVEGVGYTLQGDGEIHGPTDIRGMGLEIVECKNVTIRNLNIKEFTRGIRFTNSFDSNIYQNSLTNNSIGIEMGYVDESYSNNNTVSGNIIKENDAGIRLIYGSSNTISGNIITGNDEGVSVWGTSGNYILWNNITDNNRGIYFEVSGINFIHHNNFVNNTNDCWDYGYTPWPFQLPFSVNIWDDGIEGNYWSNYDGIDSNGDGVGDTPHNLYENNTDNHPLIEPVTIEVITEFPSWTILPFLLMATLAAIICKKRLTKTPNQQSY